MAFDVRHDAGEVVGLGDEVSALLSKLDYSALVTVLAAIPVGTAAPGVAGGTNDGKVKDKTAEVVREVASLVQKAITVTTTNQSQMKDTSGASGKTGVPVLDDPEDIKAIQQMLEESEEELEQIMNQIQSLFNQIVAIVQSKTETDNLIVQNMSQMI